MLIKICFWVQINEKKEEKSCIGFSEGFEISRLKNNNNNNNNNLPDKDERIFHLPVLIIKYD